MPRALDDPATRVWAILVVLTAAAFWTGADHGLGTGEVALASVLVIAMIKVRLVAWYFMELRHAPAFLRRVVDTWFLVTGVGIVGMYLAL